MTGPNQKREKETDAERDPVERRAPDDVEREGASEPNPDIDRGRDMVERRPHRDGV